MCGHAVAYRSIGQPQHDMTIEINPAALATKLTTLFSLRSRGRLCNHYFVLHLDIPVSLSSFISSIIIIIIDYTFQHRC